MGWFKKALKGFGSMATLGLTDTLFDKDTWSGGSSELSTQPVSNYTPEQNRLFQNLLNTNPYSAEQRSKLFFGGQQGSPWWKAQQTPTSQETSYLSTLENYPTTARSNINRIYDPSGVKSIYGDTSYINNAYRPEVLNQIYNPQDAMKRVMDRFSTVGKPQWEQDVAPLIRSEYAGPNYWGSARAGAVTKSLNDLYSGTLGQMYDVGNQWDTARAGALTNLEGSRSSALVNNELAGRGTLASNEQMKQQALQMLLGQEPALAQQAADFSRSLVERKNPYTDPAYLEALKLLGLDAQTVIGGVTEEGPGIGYGLLSGAAGGLGKLIGGMG